MVRIYSFHSHNKSMLMIIRLVGESDYSPACSKRSEFLRILSGSVILTSIKGRNSLTNLPKMTANNPYVDLVSINSYIKFCQNLFICSQDIERKQNLGVN